MGGVRALSIAKCTAAAAPRKAPIDDYLSGFPLEDIEPEKVLPYIELPTTCRNPFLLTETALMIDARDRSPVLLNTRTSPKTVIIDPSLATSLTAHYTFTTLLDTLLLALEGFLSQRRSFLSDLYFLEGGARAFELSQGRWRDTDSHSAREAASEAGTLVALGLSRVSPGMGSYLSHGISGVCEVPQSSVASVLLPHIIEWAETQVTGRYNQFVDYIISHAPLSKEDKNEIQTSGLADLIREYMSGASVPARLMDLSIKPKHLTGVIQNLFNMDCLEDMPREVQKEDIDGILEKAL
jgi:alcohol dehydrogenase